jgi:dienelactone hydrolase
MMRTFIVAALCAGLLPATGAGGHAAILADPPATSTPEEILGFWMQRYTTTDRFGRTITFYLSKTKDPAVRLPLVVCVAGSGSQSLFVEVDTPQGKRIATGGPESAIRKEHGDHVRLLVVEKPGVRFLDKPGRMGGAEDSSEEFRREHTLERWSAAVGAAMEVGRGLPGVDGSRVLVLGHSEGGIVACRVAAEHPSVTHVAVMAGGGPTQLYDLIELARRGKIGPPGDPEAGVKFVLDGWRQVMENPDATDAYFMGHPHRRWTSFCQSSPIEEIVKSRARVLIAQGTADTAVLPESADVLYAELLARGRDVTYEKVEGGDHGFMNPADADPRAGWLVTNRKAVAWFIGEGAGTRGDQATR